jgi:hypothetical protein
VAPRERQPGVAAERAVLDVRDLGGIFGIDLVDRDRDPRRILAARYDGDQEQRDPPRR